MKLEPRVKCHNQVVQGVPYHIMLSSVQVQMLLF